MNILAVFGFIGAVLLWVYYMIRRAKSDEIISNLSGSKVPSEQEDIAIAQAQKELEDAEIRYRKSRSELESTTPSDGSK